jgi:hypothetical protein
MLRRGPGSPVGKGVPMAISIRKGQVMVTIVEHTEGHYNVQEVEFGRVYRWCPQCVIVDCDCGERLTLTASSTAVCRRCGADHTATVRAELAARRMGDEVLRPWRYAGDREGAGLPC